MGVRTRGEEMGLFARKNATREKARASGIPWKSGVDVVEFVRQERGGSESLQKDHGKSGGMGLPVEGLQEPRERLVSACFLMLAQGRLQALGALYEELSRDIFGYIRSIVGSAEDAEDAFQEVFSKLASLGEKACRVERPLGYVFAVARNEAYKVIRKRASNRETAVEEGTLEAVAPREREAEGLTPREAEQALSLLPVEQREVVVLKIWGGLTFAQVGEVTGVSQNTAASRYRYAMGKLAQSVKRISGSG